MTDLERALEGLPAQGAVGLLRTDEGIWRSASGEAGMGGPADSGDRFGIASITKTFVAAAVLRLVEEERLSLGDSIEDALPGALPYGRRITVRQLLNHSSGLWESPISTVPREILPDVLADEPLVSHPGAVHRYANVNFVVLGLIVEEVTGHPLKQVVRDRIFVPLGLDHTSFGAARTRAFEPAPWLGAREGVNTPLLGAGGIASTVDDVSTFFRALLSGKLIGPDLLAEMTHTIEGGDGYRAGLGIFREDLSCGTAWGHGGEEHTYSSMALASRDGSRVVVVAQNSSGWTLAIDVAEEIYCSS